ncbi:hypothetical protein BMT54_01270 [Pasteurellaceae bacterium 15-036681]|nr:hypothetical protein BMT54_01270 [Pasteurellaceae bacterium 15-036681]
MQPQTRQQMIQKIHIGKNELKLDDNAYKTLLLELVDKPSCSMMTDTELMTVLQGMKAKGFRVKSKKFGKKPSTSLYDNKQTYINKIEAMIADNGLSWGYVLGICRRSFKKERLQWCSEEELHKIVQMLAVYLHKQGKRVK